jgi:hypothetical protein
MDYSALIARVARQEIEIESLCAEIVERYEEATFVYRLSEQIGSVLGERAIAGLVVREAANVLGAHTAELWFKTEAGLARVAAFPEGRAQRDALGSATPRRGRALPRPSRSRTDTDRTSAPWSSTGGLQGVLT